MKRFNIILLLLILSLLSVWSQEKVLDTSYIECQYEHYYLRDTLDVSKSKDLFILQIGKKVSKFYSYYSYQQDSLLALPDGKKIWNDMFTKALSDWRIHRDKAQFLNSFPHYRASEWLYKNYPEGKITVNDAIGNEGITYVDTLNAQSWRLMDSTKTILNYVCQKAECDFRGRHWTAWFTTDIPVNDGPWKLSGLPGLIMEAYDNGKQYYFGIRGLQKIEKPIYKSESSHEKNTSMERKKFLRLTMQRLTNYASVNEAESGLAFGSNGPIYRDLIERDYK